MEFMYRLSYLSKGVVNTVQLNFSSTVHYTLYTEQLNISCN